jgi:surfeit locus 1 family protein
MSARLKGVQPVSGMVLPAVSTPSDKPLAVFLSLFSRRWILATLLVLAGIALTIRLGIWQLDRLAQRRAFNSRVAFQMQQPELLLSAEALVADLARMEYRPAKVHGFYDFSQQVALRNQAWDNQGGVHLITPLRIEGSQQAVLVDRGWVPVEDFSSSDWSAYDEPGLVEVEGVIRASQAKPDFGRRSDTLPAPGEPPLKAWNFVNVQGIARQMPYALLPVYVQQVPDPAWSAMPYRSAPELDLSEGPHQGYALQWFTFAALLLVGYPYYVFRRLQGAPKAEQPTPQSSA